MKIPLLFVSITFCSNSFALSEKIDNSITIHNEFNAQQQLWVNAVSYDIASNSSLRVPCNLGENIEVQFINESVILACGSKKELK